ncbi:NAD(P)-dependent alcohol dehydrogenase [Rhodococcus sp. NPDC057014]|uniref:NAD(P)-dependent alcohol dehydrogenase n=1 Tax=Rhodococcus TaxID=1827 RepID=UPI001C465149|nr:NAD(P)-dependent alcohol dehydrogenase [Rhodococcus opacus]MBV6762150.1 NAD(P)-dependent alcohol dehydrogenase [Rhodococcus opacus]
MRAARLPSTGSDLVVEEIPDPTPGPGQVVVKIAASGVCHSDVTIQNAGPGMPSVPYFPWTLGHENTGYVHALGDGVTDFEVGDAVAVWPGWGDGTCRVCRAGHEHICPNVSYVGVTQPGGWADYLLVPAARHLVPLGDLDPVEAAPLTDAGLTAYGAVSKVLDRLIESDRSVAVIGAGGLGQFAIKYLSALTSARIVAVDIDAGKREHALTIGASMAVDSTSDDAVGQLLNVSGDGLGVDAVIDFVGVDSTLALAAGVTAPCGAIVLVGIGGGTLPFGYTNPNQQVQVSTSSLGSRADLASVISLWKEHGINADATRYSLDDVNQALQDLAEHKIAERGVLVM